MSVETELWSRLKDHLLTTGRISSVAMDAWFRDCRVVELTASELILFTASPIASDIIENRLGTILQSALSELLPGEYDLRVLNDETLGAYNEQTANLDEDTDYTFDRFVVGNSNKFAHAAAVAVANGNVRDYNPLFIYGNSGLGKTHLLRAIRHEIRQKHPEYNIVYVKSEEFTSDFIKMTQTGSRIKFRSKYRDAHVLLIDDIQFVSGQNLTQEEFFHTFETLHGAGRQIVLTSDRPPGEISRLEDRLRTRFESGLMADINPPDYETRTAIVLNKARELGFTLPMEIVVYIVEKLTSNIRQLEGAVKQIYAYSSINGTEALTVAEAARRIKDMIRETERSLTTELILSEAARFFQLTIEDLKGPSRTRNIATARQVAMYLIRRLLPLISLADIGVVFGGRDHSTVLSGIAKIESALLSDSNLGQTIRDITSNIQSKAEST